MSTLEAVKFKVCVSAAIVVAVCVIAPMIGLSASPIDEKEGVMVDFGYYNVKWVEMELGDGVNGVQALEQ
ncbi:MAG: hypothetical protein IIT75_00210, partial [Candidatus Methanomethylophilus sp.]|nr:hypothetical protein [Methanomethylophilus sp.]